jgi:hypothetical protein
MRNKMAKILSNFRELSDKELVRNLNNLVEGWSFDIAERTAGYYRVEGTSLFGNKVSRDGLDPVELLEAVIVDIQEIFPD